MKRNAVPSGMRTEHIPQEYRGWREGAGLRSRCQRGGGCPRLDIEQIDGLASFSNDTSVPWLMQQALGLPRRGFTSMVWGGGSSGTCGAIAYAVAAVESGQAEYVGVFRPLCQDEGHRYGQLGGYNELPHLSFMVPFGMFSQPIMIAPLVQRYIHEFGAQPEHFGEVALVCRDNAHRTRAR